VDAYALKNCIVMLIISLIRTHANASVRAQFMDGWKRIASLITLIGMMKLANVRQSDFKRY